ncbi:hypothetical protein, partial [Polaromonas sp.]|uniref:hypothetical protein n=1 Tax=Polaromonas sp. TaxID=1869339 RepID=UPI002FCB7431
DFCSGQGANHSNSPAIARICNAVMDEKTRFYVPDSVQHHTSTFGLPSCLSPSNLPLKNLSGVVLSSGIACLI